MIKSGIHEGITGAKFPERTNMFSFVPCIGGQEEDDNDDRRLEISGLCPSHLIDRRRSEGEPALNTTSDTTSANTSITKTCNTSVANTSYTKTCNISDANTYTTTTTTLRVSLRSIPISGGQSGLLGVRCLGKSRRNLEKSKRYLEKSKRGLKISRRNLEKSKRYLEKSKRDFEKSRRHLEKSTAREIQSINLKRGRCGWMMHIYRSLNSDKFTFMDTEKYL